ncbi:ABC transporter permease [uncultured Aquimonas sp.]|uniref:ABC transporter permease n=1 Tax=uncultured Aquimonas sp. TaxID=385483 RepID=UPI00261A92FC|nr:ABC transporter permease [uncultured Aquimonas sp.]
MARTEKARGAPAVIESGLGHAVLEGSFAAIAAIRANALRSALTALGIIIGVAAVIAVVAVMQGLSSSVTKQLDDLASDMVIVSAYTPRQQAMLGLRNTLSSEDFLAVRERVREVEDMTAVTQPIGLGGQLRSATSTTTAQILGTTANYQHVVRVYTDQGRFISDSDDARRRRVVVLGTTVVKDLELGDNPVGQFVQLGSEWFRVIGVGESRGTLFGFDQDNYVFAPFSTLRSLSAPGAREDVQIYFRPKAGGDIKQLEAQVKQVIRARRALAKDAPDPVQFQTAERTRENFDSIVSGVTMVAGAVVGISLLVGGIGVMNIMLVSVTERTREIGIVKALGATPRFILLQFLVEALVLSLFGGLIGLALGWAFALVIGMGVPGLSGASVPGWAVLLSLGFTTAIGVIFGLAPAVKAARLNPIEALRYE